MPLAGAFTASSGATGLPRQHENCAGGCCERDQIAASTQLIPDGKERLQATMTRHDLTTGSSMSRTGLRSLSAVLAFAVFLVDVLTPLEGAVAVLYIVAILLAAKTNRRDDTIVAAGCIALTVTAYLVSHDLRTIASPALRVLVSLAAIGITTLLALQNHAATKRLAAQARLLNLSHDMIFVRDRGGVITFWNKTAEQVYGWSAEEVVGQLTTRRSSANQISRPARGHRSEPGGHRSMGRPRAATNERRRGAYRRCPMGSAARPSWQARRGP